MSTQPLEGVRIVDLTHVWAGPLATRILGDLGADVIKVEAPLARGPAVNPPPGQGLWVGGEPGADPWNRQSLFTKLNRAKRGLCLDLKSAGATSLLLDLIRHADVVIENFSAAAMRRLGLDYEQQKAVNPDIIYISMPGFGTTGPYSKLTAFGPSVEPMIGLGALMGYSEEEPRNTAMALVDTIGGVSAAAAVMTALAHRQETGKGTFLELSLHEAGVSFFGDFLVDHQLGNHHGPIGNAHPRYAPHGIYPAAGEDEWLAIACPMQDAWLRLASLIPELRDAPRWQQTESRLTHRSELDDIIAGWTVAYERHDLVSRLQAHGIAAGAVNAAPDFMDHPHLLERGYWVDLALQGQPRVRYPGLAIRINDQPPPHGRPAPKFGEHNRQVLREWLDRSESDIDDLLERGVLLDRPPAG